MEVVGQFEFCTCNRGGAETQGDFNIISASRRLGGSNSDCMTFLTLEYF